MKRREPMPPFSSIASGANRASDHFPWPRFVVSEAAWEHAGEALDARHVALLGYWGEPCKVHLALADQSFRDICVITRECPDGQFPSIAVHYPPAGRLERTIHDLYGLRARGTPDHRPWLDHGRWRSAAPHATASRTIRRRLTRSFQLKARACTRSGRPGARRHHRARALFASPPTARRWSGWSSVSAMCTRASRA